MAFWDKWRKQPKEEEQGAAADTPEQEAAEVAGQTAPAEAGEVAGSTGGGGPRKGKKQPEGNLWNRRWPGRRGKLSPKRKRKSPASGRD